MSSSASDYDLARKLQEKFDLEFTAAQSEANSEVVDFLPAESRTPSKIRPSEPTSLVAPEWEDVDPTPDLHALFLAYNDKFFWGRLLSCEVKWSPRMTVCAGLCSYQGRGGLCSIRLSVPLLKLRPRKDFVETLLHEMIHAYLFVTDGNDDHDGHGPAFHEHMFRINKEAGTKISVYHNFHDEVAIYKTHWWKCEGPCQNRKPFYGMVKRSMNRAPGPNDRWWAEHQAMCGGRFIKVKEPEGFGQKKSSKRKLKLEDEGKGQKDIRGFFGKKEGSNSSFPASSTPHGPSGSSASGNVFGFGGTSFGLPGTIGGGGGVATKGRSGTVVVNPRSRLEDNSSGGRQIVDSATSTPTPSTSGGSGHRLSGAVGELSAGVDARQMVRSVWAGKYDGGGGGGGNAKGKEDDSSSTAECPVCSQHVKSAQINQHLDECLTKQALVVDEGDGVDVICQKCKREVNAEEWKFHDSVCS